MPPQAVDLEPFHDEISRRVTVLRWDQDRIVAWLAREHDIVISKVTLRRRLTEWGVTRRAGPIDPTLIAAIDHEFHHTLHNDREIAQKLNSQGFNTSHSQVKDIRLSHGWRHYNRSDADNATAVEATFQRVDEALEEGTARNYGREFLQSNLRSVHGFRATENTIRDALATLDPGGTAKRKPGPGKGKKKGEFNTKGPDYVWSIDGHDKFRDYGIHIYAAVDGAARKVKWFYINNSNRT